MRNDWIKANVDFGLRWKQLVISQRSLAILRENGPMIDLTKDDPDQLAAECKRLVEHCRPQLADGRLEVVGMRMTAGMRLSLQVTHPSFPKIGQVEWPGEERLELCPVCNKPQSMDKQWMAMVNDRGVEVCSEACYSTTKKFATSKQFVSSKGLSVMADEPSISGQMTEAKRSIENLPPPIHDSDFAFNSERPKAERKDRQHGL